MQHQYHGPISLWNLDAIGLPMLSLNW